MGIAAIVLFAQCKKDLAIEEVNTAACNLKPDSGPCRAMIPRYYYDAEEGKCKEFTWGGCEGVVPFETMEDCRKLCE